MNGTGILSVCQGLFNSFRYVTYTVLPSETYFKDTKGLPDFNAKGAPAVLVLFLAEVLFKAISKSGSKVRLYTFVVNLASYVLNDTFRSFMFRGAEIAAYTWVYKNFRIASLPYNSPYTFFIALFGVDFGYYWWHRMSHELNIMWAAHYLHHSAEDFNISVSFRNAFLGRPFRWVWFLYMAILGIPPITYIIHAQLAFAFAAWTHCESIPKLGTVIPGLGHIMEFFILTPSHHRVHHGVNRYCIDKNYGIVLIVWDRIFDTFEEEREDEVIQYGTIGAVNSYDILGTQLTPWMALWKKIQRMDKFGNKMRAIFYGPGWEPGTPRLGNPEDIPDVRGRKKYEIDVPSWVSIYSAVHSLFTLYSFLEMSERLQTLDNWVPELNFCCILLSLTSIGGIIAAANYSVYLEPIRLVMYLALLQYFPLLGSKNAINIVTWLNSLSLLCYPAILSDIKSRRTSVKEHSN